jgi:antitoxin component of RelBE/YafQ-DinJ toxin-antitoxin module
MEDEYQLIRVKRSTAAKITALAEKLNVTVADIVDMYIDRIKDREEVK